VFAKEREIEKICPWPLNKMPACSCMKTAGFSLSLSLFFLETAEANNIDESSLLHPVKA